MAMVKYCTGCKKNKEIDEYHYQKSRGKHRAKCKNCTNSESQLYKKNNIEKVKETHKNFRINNKDKLKEKSKNDREKYATKIKEYRQINAEKIKTVEQNYRNNNKDKIKITNKIYYENNKEKVKDVKKKYYNENKTKIIEKWKKYKKQRINMDPSFKLLENLRRRISHVLHAQNTEKTHNTSEILGCTSIFFKNWLEYQFDENMTWSNYNLYWNMDHVIPCSSFDMNDETDQKECFNWKNTRPLKKEENGTKSNKIVLKDIIEQEMIVSQYITKLWKYLSNKIKSKQISDKIKLREHP